MVVISIWTESAYTEEWTGLLQASALRSRRYSLSEFFDEALFCLKMPIRQTNFLWEKAAFNRVSEDGIPVQNQRERHSPQSSLAVSRAVREVGDPGTSPYSDWFRGLPHPRRLP